MVLGTCVLGDLWVWGTCGCRGHVGEGDIRVSQTIGINVQTGKLMLATSFSG